MTFGQITFGQMTLGQMTLGQMTFGQMTIGQMTFGQMTLGQMTFGQMAQCQIIDSASDLAILIFFNKLKLQIISVSTEIIFTLASVVAGLVAIL